MTEVKRLAAQDDAHSKDGLAFELSSPINPAQLEAEIKEATGWRSPAGLVLDGGRIDEHGLFGPLPEAEAVEGVTATLTVTHADIDAKLVAKVIKAHQPEPVVVRDASDVDVEAAIGKAQQGEPLSVPEMSAVLAQLLKERAQG